MEKMEEKEKRIFKSWRITLNIKQEYYKAKFPFLYSFDQCAINCVHCDDTLSGYIANSCVERKAHHILRCHRSVRSNGALDVYAFEFLELGLV